MAWVNLVGLDRPGLVDMLAARGIRIGGAPTPPRQAAICTAMAPDPSSSIAAARARCFGQALLVTSAGEAGVVEALDCGFEDAVPHSASDALIAARLAALVRRGAPGGLLRLGDLAIDRIERVVTRGGRAIALLPREYRLLLALAERAGETVSRASLIKQICGLDFDPGTNVLEVQISRLRARLDRGFAGRMIITDKGRGYRLVPLPDFDTAIAGERAAE